MRRQLAAATILCSLVAAGGAWLGSCSAPGVDEYTEVEREPRLSPDYAGTVIPANIAPLNFRILEEGRTYRVTVRPAPDPQGRDVSGPDVGSDQGRPIRISSRTGQIRIPVRQWHTLLAVNRGRAVFFDVYVQGTDRQWRRFRPVANTVAPEDIDATLVFRYLKPAYNWWHDMGIYQRDLTGYDTSVVLQGRSFGGGCLNCHSFVGNDPGTMTISLRSGTYGSDTLLARGGAVDRIGAKWGYTAWHPSGAVAVYSLNRVTQFFQAGGMEVRDVVDLDSALVCYRVASGRATCPAELADKNRLETYPAWSPDGQYLYFCSAPVLWQDRTAVPPDNYDKVKYDLRRISYDVATDQWGRAETVLSADETGQSILLPRISPDGRFLAFCMCRYGCFPVYQPSSDLYLMDLNTRQYHKLAINSEFAESWHSWSSNSRWLAFSSKRQGGRFTRTYFSYIDSTGTAHKPFVLPQRDPTCYDSLLETYSAPELVQGPLPVRPSRLARAARAKPSVVPTIPLTGATPKAAAPDPWQERE